MASRAKYGHTTNRHILKRINRAKSIAKRGSGVFSALLSHET